MKILSNSELPLWLNCNQMDIKVIISKGGILLFGQKKIGISDVLFKIYYVLKSIPAAKSQNFVNTLGPQKPRCTNILKFVFSLIWKDKIIDITRKDHAGLTSPSYINLTMKLLIKLQNSPKNRAKMKLYTFWETVSHFCFRWLFIFSGFLVPHGMV